MTSAATAEGAARIIGVLEGDAGAAGEIQSSLSQELGTAVRPRCDIVVLGLEMFDVVGLGEVTGEGWCDGSEKGVMARNDAPMWGRQENH